MRHYPVFLNLENRLVLLIGGGNIALQKVPALLESGARIVVVSPAVLPEFAEHAQKGALVWHERVYETTDLQGVGLVIAATDDEALQKRVAAECRERQIWVNVVDVPPLCDFIAPAIVRQGPIQVAISTGGVSPALAKFLRRKLEGVVGPQYAHLASVVQKVRGDILRLPKSRRDSLWECIVSDDFISEIQRDGAERAVARVKEWIHGQPAV
jgi:siroheme synthase-like protein